MMIPKRIPMFPLDVVLFPGMPLPLHIFEPRYKLMTRRCLDEHLEFGVVLARPEGIAPVGCSAEIVKVVRQYPDGRMDILTTGNAVFQIVEVFEDRPYLEAQVEYLVDQPEPVPEDLRQKLVRACEECQSLLYGRRTAFAPSAGEAPLSYQILGALPFDLDYKQEMIEIQSEAERQANLLERMEKWLPQLAHMDKVRKTAGGNGHGLR